MNKHKIVIGVTGASGAIYTKVLLEKLATIPEQIEDCRLVFSDHAKQVWEYELGAFDASLIPFKVHEKMDFFAPFASGSAGFDTVIICPCTMGTLGKIASGISSDLISRAADVILKERRRLILVTRETPLSLIHIQNMKTVTEAGAIICPASPSFYTLPSSIEEVVSTVTNRVLQIAEFQLNIKGWGYTEA